MKLANTVDDLRCKIANTLEVIPRRIELKLSHDVALMSVARQIGPNSPNLPGRVGQFLDDTILENGQTIR